MADVTVDPKSTDPKQLVCQGMRAFVMQDFNSAVQALGKASEILAQEHGDDLHESLGDVYLYYGKALLELSRQENEPLGDAIPKGDNEDSEEDEENGEEADEDEKKTEDEGENRAKEVSADIPNGPEAGSSESEVGTPELEPGTPELEDEVPELEAETSASEAGASGSEAGAPGSEAGAPGSDTKAQESIVGAPGSEAGPSGTEAGPSGSEAGPSRSEAGPSRSTDKATEEANEEPSDLQLAWEVLELAKTIFRKKGTDACKLLAETLIALGEVALESENFDSAINDMKQGLEIQVKIFSKDSRTVAETYYKLGITYSTNLQINESIESFQKSLEYLRNRLSVLDKLVENKKKCEEEIKEINELLPELEEKIADMKNYNEEAMKKIAEASLKESVASNSKNPNSSTTEAKDISHLVKRKRKADESNGKDETGVPTKKTSL